MAAPTAYVCCSEAGELCARECNGTGPEHDGPAFVVPNAESPEFSRLCDMDGDLEPVDGGLKNDLGSCRMRNGNWSGFLPSGFRTVSNSACKSVSEFWSTRTTRLLLTPDGGLLGPIGSILMLTCWCCSCCCCCKPDMLTSSVGAGRVWSISCGRRWCTSSCNGVSDAQVYRPQRSILLDRIRNTIGCSNNYDNITAI